MDGWAYSDDRRDGMWSMAGQAERRYPGLRYVDRSEMTTGLWVDVRMERPDGSIVTRRLIF